MRMNQIAHPHTYGEERVSITTAQAAVVSMERTREEAVSQVGLQNRVQGANHPVVKREEKGTPKMAHAPATNERSVIGSSSERSVLLVLAALAALFLTHVRRIFHRAPASVRASRSRGILAHLGGRSSDDHIRDKHTETYEEEAMWRG
jgi:hypothetical protein